MYSYIKDEEYKETKGTEKCVVKREIKFENCKNCLNAAKTENDTKVLKSGKYDVG